MGRFHKKAFSLQELQTAAAEAEAMKAHAGDSLMNNILSALGNDSVKEAFVMARKLSKLEKTASILEDMEDDLARRRALDIASGSALGGAAGGAAGLAAMVPASALSTVMAVSDIVRNHRGMPSRYGWLSAAPIMIGNPITGGMVGAGIGGARGYQTSRDEDPLHVSLMSSLGLI